MRNLLKYPIDRGEASACLLRLRDIAVKDDEMAMRCGNLDSYILACAAALVLISPESDFKLAFGVTEIMPEDQDASSLPK